MKKSTDNARLRVVFVGAHPDDEISAAGTLVNYARAGHQVTVVTMTRGGMGHMTMPSEELKRVRTAEGEAAAIVIGAELRWMDWEDSAIPETRDAALGLVELFRELRPDIVITHGPEQRHPDHRATCRLVSDAYYLCSLPLLKTAHDWHGIGEVYFMDSPEPDTYVDITASLEAKVDAAACHKSQYQDWLVNHDAGVDRYGISDFRQRFRDAAAYHGHVCGVRYAEAFRAYFPRKPRATTLLPLRQK